MGTFRHVFMIIWSLHPKTPVLLWKRPCSPVAGDKGQSTLQRCLQACQPAAARPHPGWSVGILLCHVFILFFMTVIDFCLTRTLVCDEDTNYQSLRLSWASKTSCDQRKGEAFLVDTPRPEVPRYTEASRELCFRVALPQILPLLGQVLS